jgi:hypothetical protein
MALLVTCISLHQVVLHPAHIGVIFCVIYHDHRSFPSLTEICMFDSERVETGYIFDLAIRSPLVTSFTCRNAVLVTPLPPLPILKLTYLDLVSSHEDAYHTLPSLLQPIVGVSIVAIVI